MAIGFEDGNPDRPYIAGVLHDSAHGDHVTIRNYKRNVLRTPSNNKIRLDDSRDQEHIKVSTEYGGKSQLNLGHLVDSEKQQRGEGVELKTDSWGAIRAQKGSLQSMHGFIQDCVMPIKFMDNKYMKNTSLLVFFLGAALNAPASEIKEIFNRQQPLAIEGVTITPQKELVSLYSDGKLHTVGNRQYFLLINGFPSRPGNPTAQCGAGQEMYADIYQVEAKKATRVQRIMVVSCWRSLELNSWQKLEDFSSITWNKDGVTFDWIVPPKFTNLRAQLNLNTVSPELVFMP